MNNKLIILEGDMEDKEKDCTYAKIKDDGTIIIKQYNPYDKKTDTIYLTKEELIKLYNEIQ